MNWKILLIVLFVTALALTPVLSFAQEGEEAQPAQISLEETGAEAEIESPGILPDSPFYGLKLFTERLRLALTFNEKAKIRLKLKLAERRLAEAERMALRNKTQVVQRLVKRYEVRLKEAEEVRERLRARNMTAEDVDEWMNRTTNKHIYVLRRVLQHMPEQARPGIQTALQRTEENRERIRERLLQRIERTEKGLERAEEIIEQAKERVEQAEERVEKIKERVNETANETETSNETAATTQAKKGRTLTTLVPI